jgi:hypothetical protein
VREIYFRINPRSCGKTSALIEACRKIGAVLVCGTEEQARDINRLHDIKTTSIYRDASDIYEPYLFDHYAVEAIIDSYASRITELKRRISLLTNHGHIKNERLDMTVINPELKQKEISTLLFNNNVHDSMRKAFSMGVNEGMRASVKICEDAKEKWMKARLENHTSDFDACASEIKKSIRE